MNACINYTPEKKLHLRGLDDLAGMSELTSQSLHLKLRVEKIEKVKLTTDEEEDKACDYISVGQENETYDAECATDNEGAVDCTPLKKRQK